MEENVQTVNKTRKRKNSANSIQKPLFFACIVKTVFAFNHVCLCMIMNVKTVFSCFAGFLAALAAYQAI